MGGLLSKVTLLITFSFVQYIQQFCYSTIGVVFNEMKGVFADAQQLFGQETLNGLLPSHTYGHCSGGLPEKIPDLTWDALKKFHSIHYSPNNAKFYTYGNFPLVDHLEAIGEYLPKDAETKYNQGIY